MARLNVEAMNVKLEVVGIVITENHSHTLSELSMFSLISYLALVFSIETLDHSSSILWFDVTC
jgi:hypothetical protein